jgi:hypothetical protein
VLSILGRSAKLRTGNIRIFKKLGILADNLSPFWGQSLFLSEKRAWRISMQGLGKIGKKNLVKNCGKCVKSGKKFAKIRAS